MKEKVTDVLAGIVAICFVLGIVFGFVSCLGPKKVKKDDISNEEIIRELKYDYVASNYNVTYNELFEAYYRSVEYRVYTKEEIEKATNVDTTYDSIQAECIDSSGNKFIFAWNIVYDENRTNGFDLIKKAYYDSTTKESYGKTVMDERLESILTQYLIKGGFEYALDTIKKSVDYLKPKIN